MATIHSDVSPWQRLVVRRIEDLQDSIFDAGLRAEQLSRGAMTGSLIHAHFADAVFSSGLIKGKFSVEGPLSPDSLGLGIGLDLPANTRHWMKEVNSGSIGIWHAGDAQEAVYPPNALYVGVVLPFERLESIAADLELVLDRRQLGATREHERTLDLARLQRLCTSYALLHSDRATTLTKTAVCAETIEALVRHLARKPREIPGPPKQRHVSRVVALAKTYIYDHIDEPLTIAEIASSAGVSPRTLYRAFQEIFDETPQAYLIKTRLNRIRKSIASATESQTTLAILANCWGFNKLDLFAREYAKLFGESPSQTLQAARA